MSQTVKFVLRSASKNNATMSSIGKNLFRHNSQELTFETQSNTVDTKSRVVTVVTVVMRQIISCPWVMRLTRAFSSRADSKHAVI